MMAHKVREHRREKVLSGMLLHVIEAAAPVNSAGYRLPTEGPGEEMSYALTFVNHIDNLDPSELPGIERLTAGGGIEGSAVQIDPAGLVRSGDNGGFEISQVRVGIIESLSHREPIAWIWG